MIIILKGADFSSSNIGVLNNYLINKIITGATINNEATSVIRDSSYSAEIQLKSDYAFPPLNSMILTMGGQTLAGTYNTNGSARIVVEEDKIKINIDKVTGNIEIKVEAVSTIAPETYYITRTLSGLSSDSSIESVEAGSVYTETLLISDEMSRGYAGPSGVEVDFIVTMGETQLVPNTGEFSAEIVYETRNEQQFAKGFMITINDVTGNISIKADAFVPFDSSTPKTMVNNYSMDNKEITVSQTVGAKVNYNTLNTSKTVYGFYIPENAIISVVYYQTLSESMGVVLLDENNNVLEYFSTSSKDGTTKSRTHTFTKTYPYQTKLEITNHVFISGRYTIN